MSIIRAAGVLVFQGNPIQSFLLLKHRDRWDLPKGHQDDGETDLQCALRELTEETGIQAGDVELIPNFQWRTNYQVHSKRHGGQLREKTVVYYLARLIKTVEIKPTEHQGYAWFPWQPPHHIHPPTIDPLLAEVEKFFSVHGSANEPAADPT